MTLECRLIRYEPETCRLVGEIVNVSADEAILDGQGMIDPDRFSPIIFDPVNHTIGSWGRSWAPPLPNRYTYSSPAPPLRQEDFFVF